MIFFDSVVDEDMAAIYKYVIDPFILYQSGHKIIIMTENGETYLMILTIDGLMRFPTANPLICGDYDDDKCLKVMGVDLL